MKSLRVPLLVFPLLAGCAPAPVYPLYTSHQVAGSSPVKNLDTVYFQSLPVVLK